FSLAFQGKYAEAEPLYARSQAIQEKVLGPEHPSLATTLHGRAGLLERQDAKPLYQRCLAVDEEVNGPDHPEVAADLNNWAGLLESRLRALRCM
ncbi:unnamed protein product, partial [Scytosiphon promiscuus]